MSNYLDRLNSGTIEENIISLKGLAIVGCDVTYKAHSRHGIPKEAQVIEIKLSNGLVIELNSVLWAEGIEVNSSIEVQIKQ